MEKIKFIKPDVNWTKLVRHIRIDDEILDIEEGDFIQSKTCYYIRGYEVTKHLNGNILWRSHTMGFDNHHKVLIKEIFFLVLLDSNLNFIKGAMDPYGFNSKTLTLFEYNGIVKEIQSIFTPNDYWDIIENGEPTDAIGSYL